MNWIHLLFGFGLAATSFLFLWQYQTWDAVWSQFLLGLADFYVLGGLVVAIISGTSRIKASKLLPCRVIDLVVLTSIFLAVLLSFAKLYINDETVCRGEATRTECLSSGTLVFDEGLFLDGARVDAINFSLVTLTMAGRTDYVASSKSSQTWVVLERLNAVSLVLLAFAIVRSRVVSA